MSAGSPRITIRVPQALLDQVAAELESQAEHSPRGPEDISLFVIRAIRERIAKRKRSRTRQQRAAEPEEVVWPDQIVSLTDRREEDGYGS